MTDELDRFLAELGGDPFFVKRPNLLSVWTIALRKAQSEDGGYDQVVWQVLRKIISRKQPLRDRVLAIGELFSDHTVADRNVGPISKKRLLQ
jgi:hypothetical protein